METSLSGNKRSDFVHKTNRIVFINPTLGIGKTLLIREIGKCAPLYSLTENDCLLPGSQDPYFLGFFWRS